MTFEEILDQAIAMLQRRGRLTYGTLKRQFQLDDAALEDLQNELIKGQRLARDEDGEVLVWIGTAAQPPAPAPAPAPLAYTPPYLVEKILTTRSALEGERKQVTVLFADLKGSTELIRDLDPEAAQALLDPVLQCMMDAVHRFEGTVNQVLGDGIMAFRQAVGWFEQALVALQHLPESRDTLEQAVDVRLDLRAALHSLGEREGILVFLHEAESFAEALHDQRRLGRVLTFMANAFLMLGETPRALAASQRALASGAHFGDIALRASASFNLGAAYHAHGDYGRAIDVLRGSLQLLHGLPRVERSGSSSIHGLGARIWLAWCLAEQGAFAQGLARVEEALQIAEAADHPLSVITAAFGAGLLSLRKGDVHQAMPVLERGLRLCQDLEIWGWIADIAPVLGVVYMHAGRLAEARLLLERGVEQADAIRHRYWQALRESWLSEAYLRSGRREEAMRLAEQALQHAQDRQERGYQAWVLRLLGKIHAQQACLALEPAGTSYHQALTLAEELGMRPLQAHCHRGLGMLYATIGQQEQARAELSAAIVLYRAMDMTLWLPQTEAALVQVT
jgi:tetratricopeptide (TPR) repeat protein